MLSWLVYLYDFFMINDEYFYFIEFNLIILKLDFFDFVFFICRIFGLFDCCYIWIRGGGRIVEGEFCGRWEDFWILFLGLVVLVFSFYYVIGE